MFKTFIYIFVLFVFLFNTQKIFASKIPGDIDLNGKVDIYDFGLVVQNFNKSQTNCASNWNIADVVPNCRVDIYDFSLVVQNFGKISSSPTTFSPKVHVLIFNPVLKTKNSVSLINYKVWNNPVSLSGQFVPIIRDASHNIINYVITGTKEVDDIPLKLDGFKYTEESYLNCLQNSSLCHNQPWTADYADYKKILDDNQICQKVNSNQIDELWIFGGPWFGFYEANMAGPGGFSTNGPVIENTSCNKPLHIMGFNYERGVSEMVHDLGHRIEGTMATFLASQTWYSFNSAQMCGDIHYPPNTLNAYTYNGLASVNSGCDNWFNYPNLGSNNKNFNCTVWGCSDLGFYKWWMQHLSYSQGSDSFGKYLNWWSYVTNANAN